jgi:hypothetical protein
MFLDTICLHFVKRCRQRMLGWPQVWPLDIEKLTLDFGSRCMDKLIHLINCIT